MSARVSSSPPPTASSAATTAWSAASALSRRPLRRRARSRSGRSTCCCTSASRADAASRRDDRRRHRSDLLRPVGRVARGRPGPRPTRGLVAAMRGALPDAPALSVHTSAAVGAAGDTGSTGPLVEAMEGFGVLRAAALAGVPAVEVRAISNEIGEPDRSPLADPGRARCARARATARARGAPRMGRGGRRAPARGS